MMLRVSSKQVASKVDLKLINGEAHGDGGIDHGKALSVFAEAVVGRGQAELKQARDALIDEIGEAGMQDAAGVAANFQRMVRIADGTGIPVDSAMNVMSQDIQAELRLDRFSSAKNTPDLSLVMRLFSPVLKRIAPIMMRRMANKNTSSE